MDITPIVKWCGGKRQILDIIQDRLPNEYGTYYEPFFGGGGSLLFRIQPHKAVINDINKMLVNVYKQIQSNADSVIIELKQIQTEYNALKSDKERNEMYLSLRNKYNRSIVTDKQTVDSAALFIFINKTCFNGLYRVNSCGICNSPFGHRDTIQLFDSVNIYNMSKYFQNCEIMHGDFIEPLKTVQKYDLVFLDPPYYGTYNDYTNSGFSEYDNKRLLQEFVRLSNVGAYCVLTNNDCDYIRNLYSNFYIETIDVKRLVNRDSSNRTGKELIITNYVVNHTPKLF